MSAERFSTEFHPYLMIFTPKVSKTPKSPNFDPKIVQKWPKITPKWQKMTQKWQKSLKSPKSVKWPFFDSSWTLSNVCFPSISSCMHRNSSVSEVFSERYATQRQIALIAKNTKNHPDFKNLPKNPENGPKNPENTRFCMVFGDILLLWGCFWHPNF